MTSKNCTQPEPEQRRKLIKVCPIAETLRRYRLFGNCPYKWLPEWEKQRRGQIDYSDWDELAIILAESLATQGGGSR